MRIELVTPPANPAITLSDVKIYAFMNTSSFDTKISSLIQPATDYLEKHIGRRLIDQTLDIFMDRDEYTDRLIAYKNTITLYSLNVSSIVSLKTFDSLNASSTVTASDYRLSGNESSAESRLAFNDNVSIQTTNLRTVDSVAIQVIAGYGASSTFIPTPLIQALSVLIEHWVRDGQKASMTGRSEIPTNYLNLISPYMSMEGYL